MGNTIIEVKTPPQLRKRVIDSPRFQEIQKQCFNDLKSPVQTNAKTKSTPVSPRVLAPQIQGNQNSFKKSREDVFRNYYLFRQNKSDQLFPPNQNLINFSNNEKDFEKYLEQNEYFEQMTPILKEMNEDKSDFSYLQEISMSNQNNSEWRIIEYNEFIKKQNQIRRKKKQNKQYSLDKRASSQNQIQNNLQSKRKQNQSNVFSQYIQQLEISNNKEKKNLKELELKLQKGSKQNNTKH